MTNAVRRLQSEGFWTATAQLALVSFLYGVFHAVGPGHGKFVISSYALANAETVRRGVWVSFMAALVQALSAIAIVGLLSIVLKATSLQMRRAEAWLESASWALIALLGLWLLYGSLRPLIPALGARSGGHGDHGHAPANPPGHHHDHHGHGHGVEGCATCGHAHAAEPSQLQGRWSWREAWSLAFAIGIRPCTGALAVLIFSLGIGLFWAGVFATFAMAVGTALTVSALAVLAVSSRDLAARLGGGSSGWGSRIGTAASVVGSALVLAMGATFFVASLNGSGPL
jgi:ABC-type nickel/cobalt efflux system permease component RcnA